MCRWAAQNIILVATGAIEQQRGSPHKVIGNVTANRASEPSVAPAPQVQRRRGRSKKSALKACNIDASLPMCVMMWHAFSVRGTGGGLSWSQAFCLGYDEPALQAGEQIWTVRHAVASIWVHTMDWRCRVPQCQRSPVSDGRPLLVPEPDL